ncbi:MAG: hypothetical protein HY744_24620 [Deltaproteobacteria bacterium]|nr:hypothetical protein [Deltaproteobacteria bacterium]
MVRASGDEVVLLDGGDVFGRGGAVSNLDAMLKGEFLIRSMDLCGYDAMTLGEEEFRFGEDFLAKGTAGAKLSVTSANLYRQKGGAAYAARFFTRAAGEIRVGVVGAIGEEHAEAVAQATAIHGEAVEVRPAAKEIGSAIAEMGPVDLLIVLAHMSQDAARALAKKLSGVQVLLAVHERLPPGEELERVGGAWLVTAGYDGKWVGHLRLSVEDGGKVSALGWQAAEMSESLADDPDLVALYQEYLARVKSEAEKIVASIPQQEPAGGAYVGAAACTACHEAQAAQWQETKHATAFQTLIDKNHDYDPSCFPCHTTGFGYKGRRRGRARGDAGAGLVGGHDRNVHGLPHGGGEPAV